MTLEEIEAHFTVADGAYRFARWGRPIVPVIFGVEDASLAIFKGAIEAVVSIAGHQMDEVDAELGVNLIIFVFREWEELAEVPNLDQMVPELKSSIAKLTDQNANQYRLFRFDDHNAIMASFVFLRMDDAMSQLSADELALTQIVQSILLWGDQAFATKSPLARLPEQGVAVLRPEIASIIRAAYNPVMPKAARDPTHALRILARIGADNVA